MVAGVARSRGQITTTRSASGNRQRPQQYLVHDGTRHDAGGDGDGQRAHGDNGETR